ncbi:MAG: DUF4405 domain-containing protein, partial [Planctomycetales bacterium]|nr:DUF4405 domain-containing protein [Planctomycetales bacterium]
VEFLFLISTGVLVRYLLPPGSGHSSSLWGLGRHEWGDVHFWIAMAFLSTLALHLVLHWKWIVCVVRGQRSAHSGLRLSLGAMGLVLGIALAAAPLAAPVTVDAQAESSRSPRPHDEHSFDIRGSMSLAEVEQQTGVPVAYFQQEPDLGGDVSAQDRLGQLRRRFGFDMDDVRDVVARYNQR